MNLLLRARRPFVTLCPMLLLLAAISSPAAQEIPPASALPFAAEIAAFENSDRTNPPPRNAILFVGSSSIRLWTTLAADFPAHQVINRGFGGSQIIDALNYFDRIVLPYRPKLIVLYAGGNDINAGKTPAQVFADFEAFARRVRASLPGTRLAYISIAPNPARWAQIEHVRSANQCIAAFIGGDPMMRYIDTHAPMLGSDGQPRPEIFVADRLHMNAEGYRIWARVVRPYLADWPVVAGAARRGADVKPVFRAGAFAMDVTPTNFPVVINGGFFPMYADQAQDPLHARCLVLDDGETRVGLCVLDSCLVPREFVDAAKREIQKATGLQPERVMISATHTHFAPSLMDAHGSEADPNYPSFLLPRIVEGFRQAVSNLAPARVGWAVVPAPDYTHTRVWIRRPDRIDSDPFGERIVRANMHPGHQNPSAIAPSGPSDPDLSFLAVQSLDGRPVAVMANYSMHYHGGVKPVSADYFGRFGDRLGELLGATARQPAFVGMMSQGTSGDQQWMDYSKPQKDMSVDAYALALAGLVHQAYRQIQWHDWAPVVMRDEDLPLATRQPSARRLEWAREVVGKFNGRPPKTLPEVYAREQIWLHEHPVRPVKLQALRVGELGIVTCSGEIFALSGLKVKARSPLRHTFFVELANGEDGYVPPAEHHQLGSYNTWACRTACLEVNAEPKIVERLVAMLEAVSGQPRRPLRETHGAYADAVLRARPAAYWRLNDMSGPQVIDAVGRGEGAISEGGVAYFLDGPDSPAFSGSSTVNRAVHLAGGRLRASAKGLGDRYTVELWFWNGLPATVRAITGHLVSIGADGVYGAPGEHLSIGGTRTTPGRLVFANGGSDVSSALVGRTELGLKTWHHLALVRQGSRVEAYLDGDLTPELSGEIEPGARGEQAELFIGGRSDRVATLEGKVDEVAVYDRALRPEEISEHFRSAGLAAPAQHAGTGLASLAERASVAVLGLRPVAAWLPLPVKGSNVLSLIGDVPARAENGVALPASERSTAQFSGGRLAAAVPGLPLDYSVACWFYNELSNSGRAVTAYLFSRGEESGKDVGGDHVGIGGSHSHPGRLLFFNGNARNQVVGGKRTIEPRTWNHLVFVRAGRKVTLYLNGEEEIDAELDPSFPMSVDRVFLGGRSDGFANLQGRMTDICLFDRALTAEELGRILKAVKSPQ